MKSDEPSVEVPDSLGEEIANSVSHGIGAGLGIAALSVLVVLASVYGVVWRIVSFSVYGATLTILLLMYTLYHALQNPKAKHVFRILDHSAIYLFIAGTYTPFTLIPLRGALGWSLFGVIWGLAVIGIIFKSLKTGRFEKVSVGVYIAMGWLGVIAAYPMVQNLSLGGIAWVLGGGLCYTAGVGLYSWRRLPYNHFIWHLFVLGGAACHFVAILLYVLPMPEVSGS